MSGLAPRTEVLEAQLVASTILATTSETLGEAPFDGTVTAAQYTPESDITGAASPASRSLTIVNKGLDGNGTTVMATLAFLSGVNATDYNETAFTLSAVAGATSFVAGDIIVVTSAPVGGTGLVDPGGHVAVTIARS